MCGIAKLPISRSKQAIIEPTNSSELPEFNSIVDEAIYLFRANIFFKNFEIKGSADRTLLYSLLFLQDCLAKAASTSNQSRKEIEKSFLITASGSNFPIPGDSNFNLSTIFPNPKDKNESEALKQYLTELRVELAQGLIEKLFAENPNEPNKWWLSLSKRKFMNKSL